MRSILIKVANKQYIGTMEYTNICEIEKNNSMRMSNQVANDISLQ